MRYSIRAAIAAAAIAVLGSSATSAEGLSASLKKGTPTLKSVGPLAFGPEGILFDSDPASATVLAIATDDKAPASKDAVKVEKLDDKVASLLGTNAKGVLINDMKVNPASGNVYLSVSRGRADRQTSISRRLSR